MDIASVLHHIYVPSICTDVPTRSIYKPVEGANWDFPCVCRSTAEGIKEKLRRSKVSKSIKILQ
jgi:hypothetical protein